MPARSQILIGFLRDAGAAMVVVATLFTTRVVCEQTAIMWVRGAAREGFSLSHSHLDVLGLVFLLLATAWSVALMIGRAAHRVRLSGSEKMLIATAIVCCALWLVPDERWMLLTARAHGTAKAPASWSVSAAANGQRRLLQYLLENGTDVNARGKYGESLLAAAAAAGSIETAELLLAHGAILENRTPITQETPLTEAAQMNHLAMVEMLVAHGADVHARDVMNRNAEDWSRHNGNAAMIDLLDMRRRTRRL